jgi:hypothetical protein
MAKKRLLKRGRPAPKTVLRLPDLEQAKSAVLNSLSCRDAQRGYRHAIDEFVDWYWSEPRLSFNKTVVLRYRMHLESRQLAPGTINLRLGAVRRLAYETADCGLLSADLTAGIRRVKGVKKLGVRLGNWLTAEQGQALWQAPDNQRLKGKCDRALLAVLLACGLRRHEAVELTFDQGAQLFDSDGASVVRSQREETLDDLIHRLVCVVMTPHVPKLFGSRLDIAIDLLNAGDVDGVRGRSARFDLHDPDSPGLAPQSRVEAGLLIALRG